MRATRSAAWFGSALGLFGLWCTSATAGDRPEAKPKPDQVAIGYEIFNREWLPADSRSHGGDGLGPVFNDTSCVACHNAGGGGGGGPLSKNIDILAASRNGMLPNAPPQTLNLPEPTTPATGAAGPPGPPPVPDALVAVHAGFKKSRIVVLHKFGTDPNYDDWRARALQMNGIPVPRNLFAPAPTPVPISGLVEVVEEGEQQLQAVPQLADGRRRSPFVNVPGQAVVFGKPAQNGVSQRVNQVRMAMSARGQGLQQQSMNVDGFIISRSQRNPTALFGLGLVDSIPESALVAEAKRQAKQSPETLGRVARLKDGRAGRLGWKAQIASVNDFVLNACANELGLEVPGHHQAMMPLAPKYQTDGLDLTADECDALTVYVRSLPRPDERRAANDGELKILASGKAAFKSVGCASCHTPTMGPAEGIYSDLLVHDMGPELADLGSYGDSSSEDDEEPLIPPFAANAGRQGQTPGQAVAAAPRQFVGATKQEWRTPPLWGFRDSGPYLHDGRAETLEQAVAMHGGQGAQAAQKFFELSPRERREVETFLKSLVAPIDKGQPGH
jgi:CxxC motif-containing protein (DUF1111 family)